MSDHTPGPWLGEWTHRENQFREKGWHIFSENGTETKIIADIPDHCGNNLEEYAESKANAHLIATAPELLEALKMFCIDHTDPCGCENCAIIRKAEGRS